MRIATFNVNGINGRLPVLLRWLADALPDVVCLQELKAASVDRGFGPSEVIVSRHCPASNETGLKPARDATTIGKSRVFVPSVSCTQKVARGESLGKQPITPNGLVLHEVDVSR